MRSSNALTTSGAAPKLSIGQVLHRLVNEYPELAPSKIRFLEEQGLVRPARTPSGYRKFSEDDVERIRTILALQRDHYLPLKVIGEYLEALDRGETPPMPGATAPAPAPVANGTSMLGSGGELSRDELQRRSGAPKELLEQAMAAGLLRRAQQYTECDVVLLSSLVELDRRGIGPRHLRPFRAAAQHEAGLIEQAVSASSRSKSAGRARAEREADELAQHLESVRRALVRSTLDDRRDA